jgi:hypothetical protein
LPQEAATMGNSQRSPTLIEKNFLLLPCIAVNAIIPQGALHFIYTDSSMIGCKAVRRGICSGMVAVPSRFCVEA